MHGSTWILYRAGSHLHFMEEAGAGVTPFLWTGSDLGSWGTSMQGFVPVACKLVESRVSSVRIVPAFDERKDRQASFRLSVEGMAFHGKFESNIT